MSIDIRVARPDDAPEITRLALELGYRSSVATTAESLRVMLGSARHFVRVAQVAENALGGWLVAERRLSLESGEGIEITGLVVADAVRRRGLGRTLVTAAEQWAVQEGFCQIRVRSNVSRVESHPFYQGIGFVLKKTQHVYEKPTRTGVGLRP